jgi:hypothetical protein
MRLLCASWSSFLCLHMGGGLHGFGEMICFLVEMTRPFCSGSVSYSGYVLVAVGEV